MSNFCSSKVFSRTGNNVKQKIQYPCIKKLSKKLHVKCEKVTCTVSSQRRCICFYTVSNYGKNTKIATCKFRLVYSEKDTKLFFTST